MNTQVTLDTPLKRGTADITTVAVRKPLAGELRGLSLTDLLQMDVGAITRVLPRVTEPALTEAEVGRMDPADLLQLGAAVTAFLLPKASRPEASPAA